MIGSLELLQSSNVLTLFNTSDPAMRTGSAGEETASQIRVDVQDEGYDLVIMNPPFTRPGSDWEGSEESSRGHTSSLLSAAIECYPGLVTIRQDMARRV